MADLRDIRWQQIQVCQQQRASIKRQRSCLIWMTGLSGAGKSTLANALECRLHQAGRHTYLLDGDNLRHGLNRDLGFSQQDRTENIRRVGEVGALMVDAGLIVIAAFISPFREDRALVRRLLPDQFIEVFVDTPITVCEQRDPKGLYRKARAGLLKNFTGIDSPFEPPEQAELTFNTSERKVADIIDDMLHYLHEMGFIELQR